MVEIIFTPRLSNILRSIADAQGYISTSTLADELNISTRTVLRELKGINHFLEPFKLTLESKPSRGYRLIGDKGHMDRFLQTLKGHHYKYDYLDKEERQLMLIAECLKQKDITKIGYLANLFNVSEGTISRDMNEIEDWFSSYGIELVRKQGYGVELIGSEDDFRKATLDFVHEQLARKNLTAYLLGSIAFDEYEYFQSLESDSIFNLLNKEILYRTIEVLKNEETKILSEIAQNSYIGLIIHLTVAIERIKGGEYIEVDYDLFEQLYNDDLYPEAKRLAGAFEREFNIKFPDVEIAYILMHIKSTRLRYINNHEDTIKTLKSDYECLMIIEKMIVCFSELEDYDYRSDEALNEGLLAHLKPALNRIHYQLEIRNPFLEQIKTQYPDLFLLTKQVCDQIEKEDNLSISDDEIGYLAMHFGAAMERKKAIQKQVVTLNVGVVCASGIGISSFLASQIKNTFADLERVIPLSVEQVLAKDHDAIDVLVSTLDLKDNDNMIVYVNALLRNEDYDRMRETFDRVKKVKEQLHVNPGEPYHDKANLALLDEIRFYHLEEPVDKGKLWHALLRRVISDEAVVQKCIDDLNRREAIGSIMINEFVFYHAAVSAIDKPVIIFFTTGHEAMTTGLLMLIHKPSAAEDRNFVSQISASLIVSDDLINSVKNQDLQHIKKTISNYIEKTGERL